MLVITDISRQEELTREEMSNVEGGWSWGRLSSYRIQPISMQRYGHSMEEEEEMPQTYTGAYSFGSGMTR